MAARGASGAKGPLSLREAHPLYRRGRLQTGESWRAWGAWPEGQSGGGFGEGQTAGDRSPGALAAEGRGAGRRHDRGAVRDSAGLQHGSSPEGTAASPLSAYCAPAALTFALGCRKAGASAQAPPCPSPERTNAGSQPAVPGEAVKPPSLIWSPSVCPLRTRKTNGACLGGGTALPEREARNRLVHGALFP